MAGREIETRRRARLFGLAAFGIGTILLPLIPADAVAQDPETALPPLQVVVLVDQSGSLKPEDVTREKEAARTIAFSVLAPNSVVSVVGFASADAPGQSPVDVACPPTVLDSSQRRDELAKCIARLDRREPEEGNGTDHANALQQALAFVESAEPKKKIVFLLTDGKLDVSNSPSWGDSADRRNAAAQARVGEVLGELERVGAQVWPLGFGQVDQGALGGFAKGKSCTAAAPDPQARVTSSSAELTRAVSDAFSSASCVKYGPTVTGKLRGGSTDLTVEIPAIASDASILVYKRDARVQVEYLAPKATQPAPASGGSNFEFAGQSTETESLRITDPEPGPWTVRLSSADLPELEVAATVVSQAAVKAYIAVSPPQPAAGETTSITMQVRARGQAVTDPEALRGLTFVTTLTGTSGFPQQQVTLLDPDQDGTFTGQLTVPEGATGGLTFTGQVTGIGIGGDTRPFPTEVRPATAAIRAQILLDSNRATVTPGGSVSGTVSLTNDTGRPARFRLVVADPSPGTSLTVEPAVLEAAAGVSTVPFTLRFGADNDIGPSAATLRLVDDASPTVVIDERLLSVDVAPEPGLVEKLFWLWVALAVLLAAALVFLFIRLRSRSEAAKVRGLKAQLRRSGSTISALEPRDAGSKAFRFVLHQDFTGPQLQHDGPGEPGVYEIRRAGPRLRLRTPTGEQSHLTPHQPYKLGNDLELVIVDERGLPTFNGPVSPYSFDGLGPSDDGGSGAADPARSPAIDPLSRLSGDPFAAPYGDPFADSSPYPAPTATYSSPGSDPYQGDPFGDSQFGNRGAVPNADDTYVDPNNPFR